MAVYDMERINEKYFDLFDHYRELTRKFNKTFLSLMLTMGRMILKHLAVRQYGSDDTSPNLPFWTMASLTETITVHLPPDASRLTLY